MYEQLPQLPSLVKKNFTCSSGTCWAFLHSNWDRIIWEDMEVGYKNNTDNYFSFLTQAPMTIHESAQSEKWLKLDKMEQNLHDFDKITVELSRQIDWIQSIDWKRSSMY